MPAPNLTEIVTTTLRNRQKEVADNVTNHNAFLHRLESKGQIKSTDGGRTIVEPLIYGDNGNIKWYDGYETFTIVQNEVVDAAEFEWKQLGGFISISGKEKVMNHGKHAAIQFVSARMKQLKAQPELSGMRVVQRGNRLSVMPVSAAEYQLIVRMGS